MAYQEVLTAPVEKVAVAQPVLAQVRGASKVAVNSLSISYRNRMVLDNVSLGFEKNKITTIIGPSGCGKSSFLMCLNRLIDLVPGSRMTGDVIIDGLSIYDRQASLTELRRKVGFVFQRPNPFPFSIRRNLELVLDEIGIRDKAERRRRIDECLSAVGLMAEIEGRLEKPALELSGGQQQRLCIARALLTNPEVLLLDEPCSALDPISTMTIEGLLRELKTRITIIIVTHNMPQAQRVGDACAVFWTQPEGGRIIECGPTNDVFERSCHPTTRKYVSGQLG